MIRSWQVAMTSIAVFFASHAVSSDAFAKKHRKKCIRYRGTCVQSSTTDKSSRTSKRSENYVNAGYGKLYGLSSFETADVYQGEMRFRLIDTMEVPLGAAMISRTAERESADVELSGYQIHTGVTYNQRLGKYVQMPIGARMGYAQFSIDQLAAEQTTIIGGGHFVPYTGIKLNSKWGVQLEATAGMPVYLVPVTAKAYVLDSAGDPKYTRYDHSAERTTGLYMLSLGLEL